MSWYFLITLKQSAHDTRRIRRALSTYAHPFRGGNIQIFGGTINLPAPESGLAEQAAR